MLKNIRIRWDPIEDRLILRLTSHVDGKDVDHWLQVTRRVAAGWRRDLGQLADRSAQIPERFDPHVKATLAAGHHHAVAQQAPMRVEPVETTETQGPTELVRQIRCGQRKSSGDWVQLFDLCNGATLTLNMTDTTLHGFIKALDNQLAQSQWGILPPVLPPPIDPPPLASGLH